MKRYRDDKSETNSHGQTLWFAVWMGGPTLSKVERALCPDGVLRTAFVCGEPDTYFSIPAYVHVKGRRVRGWLGLERAGTVYVFHSQALNSKVTP